MSDTPLYQDDDLVYVDPDARAVVKRVEFTEKGLPKPLPMPSTFVEADDEPEPSETKPATTKGKAGAKGPRRPRKPKQRYYPWGTYRTMKKLFKIEGKVPEPERTLTLDDVMEKALKEPYWD